MSMRGRLVGALRTTVRGAREAAISARASLDEALLFSAHEQASKASQAAISTSQSAGATAAQQRSMLDAAADHARLLLARGRDVRAAAQRVRDELERAKLVALNTGLEGARLGESAGKALVSVADELRGVLGRAIEALEEQQQQVMQSEREREKLRELVDAARQGASALADELLRTQAAQRDAINSIDELGKSLQRTTGTDPDVAKALTTATEHARGLLGALEALSSRSQRGLVLRALRPTIQPLLRLMREERGGPDGEDR